MSKPLDLSMWEPIVTKYKVTHEYAGSRGSYFEPAESPEEEIVVQEIEIEGLDPKEHDETMLAELLAVKVGDMVGMETSFEDGKTYEINSSSKVRSVKYDERKQTLTLGVSMDGKWVGDTPAQSMAGRG